LQHLGVDAEIEPSEAPDNAVQIDSGKRVGIEVTELVDGKMRGLHAARRKAERDKGLSPQEAFDVENEAFRIAKNAAQMAREKGEDWKDVFWSVYRDHHPTPDYISPYKTANWTAATVAAKIDERLQTKDAKVGGNAALYDEIWLAVFTDEMTIYSDTIMKARELITYRPMRIKRVFVVLGYDPAIGSYPVVEIPPLWSALRGHGYLWHRTSLTALRSILSDHEITPNTGQFPSTFRQSGNSHGRSMHAVSLFDFDTASERDVLDHRYDYCSGDVFIRIRREALDSTKLLSHSCFNALPDATRHERVYVPYLETLHIGPIPETAFDGLILAPINAGDYFWHETTSDEIGLRDLLEIAVKRKADEEREGRHHKDTKI
jgi:hypothetical protein